MQMGVGGIDTWGSTPLKEYMLEDMEYTFRLVMAPHLGISPAPCRKTELL